MNNNAAELIKLASSLQKFMEENEKLSLPILSIKLAHARQAFPEDYTIGIIHNVVSKMMGSKTLISRAEFKDLYEKFHSRNTKFAGVFHEELGTLPELKGPTYADPSPDQSNEVFQQAYDQMVDPVLASSLQKAFGNPETKSYTETMAKKAIKLCQDTLPPLALATKVEAINGNKDIILCLASFETPKGTTSIFVPVEMVENQMLAPVFFIGNSGPQELTKDNLISHITTKAGEKLTLTAKEVLDASIIAKGDNQEISEVELAITKLNASQEQMADALSPQILGQKVETENPNLIVNLPKIEDPQIEAISQTFGSPLGAAAFIYGADKVRKGHNLIANRLETYGFKHYNIAVSDHNEEAVIYSVALNGGSLGFKVPVNIGGEEGMVPPLYILCNGSLKYFEKADISELLREGVSDKRASAVASSLYGIKPGELVAIVRSAVAEGNYVKAEDALNVLSELEDEKAYEAAVKAFSEGLKPVDEASASPTTKCAMIVQSKHSQSDMCGHTGLPLHKVYQDKFGNCQPLYRQGMDDSYDGAAFMSNKVYLKDA